MQPEALASDLVDNNSVHCSRFVLTLINEHDDYDDDDDDDDAVSLAVC